MQTQTPTAPAAVLFEDPTVLGFDLSEDDDGADDIMGALDGIQALLDDTVGIGMMQRLRLTGELAKLRKALEAGPSMREKLALSGRLAAVRRELGAAAAAAAAPAPTAEEKEAEAELVATGGKPRRSTQQFYDFDPNRKQSQRKRDNAEAMALIKAVDAGTLKAEDLTDAQRQALARYSGTGGALVGADGKKGSAYEYYTPKPIAEGMWNLLRELGFSGGRALDPCGGVGIFGATAPENAAVDAVELNATSGRINQLVNDGPGYNTTVAPFEQFAAATPDESYDVVVSNVPFGEVADRGGNQLKDPRYQNEPIQNYFILRSLEKLRPGGLAAFITPPRCVSGRGGKEEDMRIKASFMAEFMGAYRLPNSVFGTAAADTMTDVIIFRKYSRDVLERIAELREQKPGLLVEANVLWQDFTSGMYFKGEEGVRNVLGTMAKAKGRFGEVDVLNSDLGMADIAKLMRKFPGSRVKWDLLDAAETAPIVYQEGDTLHHAGQTLQMRGGRWVAIGSAAGNDEARAALAESVARLTTALGAVNSATTYEGAERVRDAMVEGGQALDVPDWLRGVLSALLRLPQSQRYGAWSAVVCGLAIDEVMLAHQGEETGFNYLENYAALSSEMKRVVSDAANPPAQLPTLLKTACKKVAIHFTKKGGFSATWRGDVVQAEDTRSTEQRFEAAKYAAGGNGMVPLAEARAALGADFDPVADDEWCLSADGTSVARADDYYIGNYADFLARIDADIAAAADDATRQKLLRQKLMAEKRVSRQDPASMAFTLFSPFVTIEERAEFVRRFVDPRFSVVFDEKDGKPYIECDIGTPKNETERNLKRFAEYLRTGGVATRTSAEDKALNPKLEKARIAALRGLVQTSGAQFSSWVKANRAIMSRLDAVANDPTRLYFRQVEDESPLTIPGLNPAWESHGYQNAWVRKVGREFGGVNGDGVGLGKTSQALLAVQHAHSIGTKKRTMIVVPNSVVSNWRKEAARVYASTDDCLYVGLTESGGSFKVNPSNYDRDLNRIQEGRFSKIFVSFEAFQRLRLKPATAEQYDAHLARVDASYANSDDKKTDEKKKGLRAMLIDQLTTDSSKSAAAPFFEDLGIDSLVIDEAHAFKNSRATVEFSGAKFLSLADPSARGLDAQAKAWYIRKTAPRRDGVILLTATPITNSPLEIYSMLSLAVGDERVNDLMLGIKGSDDFMDTMCRIENREEETLDGLDKPYDVFTGLINANLLRQALATTVTARTAEQVGAQIVAPEADETPTPVALPDDVKSTLIEYKEAFRFALDTIMEKKEVRGSEEAYNRVAAKFGEPMELIAHPFNLINKMSSLIADPELDQRGSFYTFAPAESDKVEDLVQRWNAKAPVEERARPGPQTKPEAIIGTKTRKDGDDVIELLRVQVRARIDGNRVIVDTIESETQAAFEAMADAAGIDFDVSVPPKLAALLANFQKEEANPRGRVADLPSGRVRQLIFCDVLSLHQKIKRLLVKRAGVAPSSIGIITGKVNGKPEQILAVQDGFNAEGDDNKYRVVIMNEKGEVGINLQKGTQAIHHLTLGWTPDSLTQRNGRGVRQGNQTERVTVYHYDAGGTFDTYKRMLVGKKAGWIDSLADRNGGDSVDIATGLTREQLEQLIDSVGDDDALGRQQERAAVADRIARASSTQGKQAVNLQTIKAQTKFIADYASPRAWAADKVAAYVTVRAQVSAVEDRIRNPKITATALVKNQNLLAELTARRAGLKRLLDEALVLVPKAGYAEGNDVDAFILSVTKRLGRGEKASDKAAEALRDGSWAWASIEVKPDSSIGNEWQSEIDMAKGMIDSSRADFIKLASEEGGHSQDVVAKAESGETAVIDGRIICAGALLRLKDGIACLQMERAGLIAVVISDDGKMKRYSAADAVRGADIALPGSAAFAVLAQEAAALEDSLADRDAIAPEGAALLFSKTVPEIAAKRTRVVSVRYTAQGWGAYQLPSPYFPMVVPQDAPEAAAVVRRIAAKQAEVVKSTELIGNSLRFICESTVAVQKADKGVPDWSAVQAFAAANSMKLTQADFDILAAGSYTTPESALRRPASATTFATSVIAGATTEAELQQRLKTWIETEALPHFDVAAEAEYAESPSAYLGKIDSMARQRYGQAVLSLQRAAAQAAAAAAAGAEPAPAAALPAEPEPDQDPNRIVGITGDTRRWKDEIKSAAATVGGQAVWDGTALCWNVPFKAYTHLTARYPAAGQALQVVESSGKLNYGRRR